VLTRDDEVHLTVVDIAKIPQLQIEPLHILSEVQHVSSQRRLADLPGTGHEHHAAFEILKHLRGESNGYQFRLQVKPAGRSV
jgi:hypothetical protein